MAKLGGGAYCRVGVRGLVALGIFCKLTITDRRNGLAHGGWVNRVGRSEALGRSARRSGVTFEGILDSVIRHTHLACMRCCRSCRVLVDLALGEIAFRHYLPPRVDCLVFTPKLLGFCPSCLTGQPPIHELLMIYIIERVGASVPVPVPVHVVHPCTAVGVETEEPFVRATAAGMLGTDGTGMFATSVAVLWHRRGWRSASTSIERDALVVFCCGDRHGGGRIWVLRA